MPVLLPAKFPDFGCPSVLREADQEQRHDEELSASVRI